MNGSRGLKKLRAVMYSWSALVITAGNDVAGSHKLGLFFDTASVDELVGFVSEAQAMCTSMFYMVQGEDAVSDALKQLSTIRTSVIKQVMPAAISAVQGLDRIEIIRIAETSHPSVMAFLIATTDVGSKDFSRQDDKGSEELLGLELGL